MTTFKLIVSEFYNIFNKKQTFFEIILNLSFILILVLIAVIFYWDSINRSIIRTSRCKVMINSDDDSYFKLDVFTKNKEKLYSITYDNSINHNAKIDCACEEGTSVNMINIPYYNYKDDKVERNLYKNCSCKKTFNENDYKNNELYYEGDAFLMDYYTNLNKNTDYSQKLIFPS